MRFIVAILGLVLQGYLAVAKDAAPKPNVVLILTDDLRPDVIGQADVRTPNLDRLAERGTVFHRATCGYPICHVSRTEILTGRCVVAEAASGKAVPINPNQPLWPEVMRKAGWHTVHCGKWHMHGTPWTRGYAATSGLYSGGGAKGQPLTRPKSATGRNVTGYVGWTFKTNDNKPLPELGIGLTPDTDSIIADRAIEAIEAKRLKPLFLSINFTAPHDPLHWPRDGKDRLDPKKLALPKNFVKQHPFDHGNINGRDEAIVPAPRERIDVQRERAVYYALVENIDKQVGRILKALEKSGEFERTIIIFSSDQGLALGSHGLMGKQNQYEHTINVPLIVAGPGIPKKRLETQCYLRDLFPTVCELCGVAVSNGLDGRSLRPALNGDKADVHDAIFGYFTGTQRMIRTNDGWKLIWYPKASRTQLFNIVDDRDELNDLVAEPKQQDRLQKMTGQLKDWLRERRDSVVNE